MSAELMSSSLVPYKPEAQEMQPRAPQQSSLSVNTLAVLAKTVYIKADGVSTPGEQIEKVAEKSAEKETGTETKMPTWTKRFAAALTGKSLSKEEQKLIEKEKAKRQGQKDKDWKASTKKWRKNLLGNTKKMIFDNPIGNFIKNHWGKLLIGLGLLFLKPAQMKDAWKALKEMAEWLRTEGPGIFKTMVGVLKEWVPKIGSAIGSIVKWLFGKNDKDRAQDKVDDMKKRDGETETAFKKRKDVAQVAVDKMEGGGKRTGGVFGEDASLMKQVLFGTGGFLLFLSKFGPDGTIGKVFELGLKGVSKVFGLIPKLPGIEGATQLGPTIENAKKLKNVGGKGMGSMMKSITTAMGPYLIGIVASVAVAFAAYKAGTWLNDKFIKPWVDKNNKIEDDKIAKERKEELTTMKSVYNITKEAGAGSAGGVHIKGSLANRMAESMKGDRTIKRKSGWWGTESDADYAKRGGGEGLTIEEVKEKYADELEAEARKRTSNKAEKAGLMSKTEYLDSEKYKANMRGADGAIVGESTFSKQLKYEDYVKAGIDKKKKAVSTPSDNDKPIQMKEVVVTPTRKKSKRITRENATPEEREMLNRLSVNSSLMVMREGPRGRHGKRAYKGKMKLALNPKKETAKPLWDAMKPEEQEKFKNLNPYKREKGAIAMREMMNAPVPMSDPNKRTETINQIHKQNAQLKSGGGVAAINNDNSVTNHYHSGKSNPSVIMKPEVGANKTYGHGH
jgi:hypothetical protein